MSLLPDGNNNCYCADNSSGNTTESHVAKTTIFSAPLVH